MATVVFLFHHYLFLCENQITQIKKCSLPGAGDFFSVDGSLFLGAQTESVKPGMPLLSQMTNNLGLRPQNKQLLLHISSTLSLDLLNVVGVYLYSVRREKSGKHGLLENAKCLPLTSAPTNIHVSGSISVPL